MIAGALTLLLTLLVLVISKCSCLIARNYTVFKIYMQIRQRLFYNSIIRYFYTGAIKLQFKSADIFLAGFTLTISCILQWAMASFILVSLYGSYIMFFAYMRKNREKLDRPSTRAKYGVLYEGLEPISIFGATRYIEFYSFTFFLRRAAFVGLTFAVLKFPGLQVMTFM